MFYSALELLPFTKVLQSEWMEGGGGGGKELGVVNPGQASRAWIICKAGGEAAGEA